MPRSTLPLLLLLIGLACPVRAAPRVPDNDAQVLERVPARAGDARSRALEAQRAAWRRDPQNVALSVALARRYVEEAAAQGDPRYVGYAQAALAPWWNAAAPPVSVRVQRAVLRQYGHQFDPALADLAAAVQAEPDNAEAWSWQAAIHMVRADYVAARRDCAALAPLVPALIATACNAYLDSMTGQAAPAAAALAAAVQAAPEADAAQRLWVLTRLAEIEQRRGDVAAAERAFRAALALGQDDVYLLAAYADLLLDLGRAAEVLPLLKDGARADVLMLRLALAAKATGDARAAGWTRELAARFDAARARGDSTHEKEESRFALALLGDAPRALTLARANYALQREAADARVLLEAAVAARQPEAAAPVLAWLASGQVEDAALRTLAAQLKGPR